MKEGELSLTSKTVISTSAVALLLALLTSMACVSREGVREEGGRSEGRREGVRGE